MVRFQAPDLPPLSEVDRYYRRSVEAQWFTNFGPCHGQLELRLEEYMSNGASALPVANATLGLMVALSALVERSAPSAEQRFVVVPAYTFAAGGLAVSWLGFEPIFADVDPTGWHLGASSLEAALARHPDQVAAILACSTYGTPPPRAQVRDWQELAQAAGVPLLVDSAAGFGSVDDDGQKLGAQGDAEVFSFHATKPFAIGEGGAITSRDVALLDRARQLANFGFDDQKRITSSRGINAKLSELHAAMALAALDRHDDVLARRRELAHQFAAAANAGGLELQRDYERGALQFLPVLSPTTAHRQALETRSAQLGIETRRYFGEPLHTAPPWRRSPRADLPNTEALADRMLCLPLHNSMSQHSVHLLMEALDGG